MTCSHVIIARACDADYDGACVQVKVAVGVEPTTEHVADVQRATAEMFAQAFDEQPERIGVAVLPYVEDHDGGDADHQADGEPDE